MVQKYEHGNISDNTEIEVVTKGYGGKLGWGYRHQQCALLFCCLTVAYSVRTCMGVALVAMVENPEENNMRNVISNETEGIWSKWIFTSPYPKLQWNKKIQDTIVSSFFWGYMILQIPAGQLAHRFGTRYLLTIAMAINSVTLLCLPWAAAYGGTTVTIIFRIIQGLSQACILPSMYTSFGKWTPLEERGRLIAFATGGQNLGAVLGMPIAGFIAGSSLGWPGIFRFYGVLSGLTAVLLWWLLADSPAKHKTISALEKKYIEEDMGQSGQDPKKHFPVPWKEMLRYPALYAIICTHVGHNWGHLTLYAEVPAFMDKIMKINVKSNGLLTALPFLSMWVCNFFYSWMTDMLIVNKILSVTHSRKLANTIGNVPPAIGLILLAYVEKDIYVVETILIVTGAFFVATNSGFHVNHVDMCPKYSGTTMSISNFVTNALGSLAPIVAASILTDVTSEMLWRKVFFVCAGLLVFTNLVYVIFGSCERAPWNEPKKKTEEEVTIMNKNYEELQTFHITACGDESENKLLR